MKRVSIDWNAKPVRAARRSPARSVWTDTLEDEIDLRRLRTERRLDKVRRALINQNGLTSR